MKMEVSTKEILEFLNEGEATELKGKLAGAILAAADSPEMTEAVDKRVYARVEEALNRAVKIEHSRWEGTRIRGWGSDIVKQMLQAILGEGNSIEGIVRNETRESVKEVLPSLVKEAIKNINNEEIFKIVAEQWAKENVEKIVAEQVKKQLNYRLEVVE
ncbi:hypothetical protein [Brevibacillus laterosporus]|uniref:hypothetical protein n=1 Tax=Brevibacillus laterosporus TaxID=1465 RepID=UPI003D259721